MLRDYMNQVAILKSVIDTNMYNEPIFKEKSISCRLVNNFKRVINDKGEEVISSGVVQCEDVIKVGDYIDDRKVIAINSMVSLDGVIGYKGYLL
ncbi:MAG: hypothetical protein DBY38_02170 [Clostridium cadaveris]|uniref:Uncharacterized protein n=1 Tax=Clostridium cadaveris TaxID=1529 RepID=A0A316M9X3_9CLOT|nr:MAG: hypothetical protein DBY38_02170 [Clostridium cadaveris]